MKIFNSIIYNVTMLIVISVLAALFIVPYFQTEKSSQSIRDGVVYLDSGGVSGSGIVIAPGVILTAKHILAGKDFARVIINDKPQATTQVISSPDTEATLLYTDVSCPCWNHITKPKLGEKVTVVGYPFGRDLHTQVVTYGEFQGYTKIMGTSVGLITTSVEAGNSGGAVFVERKGHIYLVGLLVLKVGTGLSGYVPIEDFGLKDLFISE